MNDFKIVRDGTRWCLYSGKDLLGIFTLTKKLPPDWKNYLGRKLNPDEFFLSIINMRDTGKGHGKIAMRLISERYDIKTLYLDGRDDHPLWNRIGKKLNTTDKFSMFKLNNG